MADLIEGRLVASTVFSKVGVDYFEPFTVKIGRRNEKCWCCLFTCLTVRAVHIEIVPKLDTDCCLNAIMLFIARRGKPVKMISDIGTNFVGAEKELAEYIAAWNNRQMEEHVIQQGISWKFNPPAAPDFGGVWERLVRSCKKAMYAVLGNRSVTEDVLSTTMCLVEQTLNARPLTQVSSDATELEAITPNHFLLDKTRTFVYRIYQVQSNLLIIESSSDKSKLTQTSSGTDSAKSTCQRWIVERNGRPQRTEVFSRVILCG